MNRNLNSSSKLLISHFFEAQGSRHDKESAKNTNTHFIQNRDLGDFEHYIPTESLTTKIRGLPLFEQK